MTDKSCADKLADKSSQVGCNRIHAIPQVLCQLRPIRGDGNDLVAKGVDVCNVAVRDFSAHGYFCCCLDSRFKVLGEDGRKVCRCRVGPETCGVM